MDSTIQQNNNVIFYHQDNFPHPHYKILRKLNKREKHAQLFTSEILYIYTRWKTKYRMIVKQNSNKRVCE